ncbi:MAG: YCF48-related protein [Ignavibacteriaceae bacterium]
MKNKYFILSFIFIVYFTQVVKAQVGWEIKNSGTSNDLYSIQFANDHTGWFVGFAGTIYHTTNLGLNWTPQPGDISQMYFSLSTFDSLYVIAVGSNGLVSKTTNGGTSWIHSAMGGAQLYSVAYPDSDVAYTCGSDGNIFNTTDGGINWNLNTFGTTQLWSIFFTDSLTGWAGGDMQILHTTNGGQDWNTQIFNPNSLGLNSIYFINDSLGWGVGFGGFILNTIDGGINWSEQNSNTSRHLYSVFFANYSIGWAVGSYGAIIKTTDGGNSWYNQESGTTEDLNSVYFINADTGFICGMNGSLLYTTDGGGVISSVENRNNQLTNYSLLQNYPNPFNPSTTISYQLPKTGNVSLKVFDVLGKEIATLVNEEKPSGSYNVEFNVYGLASGIYYYQIKAGEFIQTKKMILLK